MAKKKKKDDGAKRKRRKHDKHHHHHEHEHAHEHEHHHHVAPEALARGAARDKILFFDCLSGIAGDMTIGALLDLGVPRTVFELALAALPLDGYELVVGHAHRESIVATKFDVRVGKKQPHRTYGEIDAMLAAAQLDEATQTMARAIFRRLGEAEARIHRMPIEEVHFHEVGAIDAIVDIVGTAAGLSYLDASEIVSSPLPMGRGFVRAQHGRLPLPAPATVSSLKGVPTYAVDLDVELVTPTGAAIIATVAQRFSRWPSIVPEKSGYGSGTMRLPDRPNVLRLVLGAPHTDDAKGTHVLLEANVDDLTGELAGHAIAALIDAGALDAWAMPAVMKKGRPALVLAAIVERARADTVAETLLAETTSIGVRRIDVTRTERAREIVEVDTRFGRLPLKVSSGMGSPPQVKPEFDACAEAARQHGVPVRVVLQEALSAWTRNN